MSNTDSEVTKAVRDIYDIDVAAIRNLSNLAGTLLEKDELLTVPGNLTTTGNLKTGSITSQSGTISGKVSNNIIEQVIPIGAIVAWSGTISTIPKGWKLCDGHNNTPNLVGRFIFGSNTHLKTIGGGAPLKISLSEMPAHTHTVSDWYLHGGKGHGNGRTFGSAGITRTTSSQGGNAAIPNSRLLPPYMKLAYIMFVGF